MLLTEKELLDIVDTLIRDRAFNRPAAVAIAMAVGAAVEAETVRRCALRVLFHSQYPIETDFDRGYNKARKDASETLRMMVCDVGVALGPNVEAAALLDEAVQAIRDRNHDTQVGEKWREDNERLAKLEAENAALKLDLQYARDGLTKGRSRMREDNERLAREAHTWSKAAETYAAELERHKPLMQAVEWILEDGHMSQEHLARLRAAWEGPNARLSGRTRSA